MATLSRRKPHFVWPAGDFGLCPTGDVATRISVARQMKSGRSRFTLVVMKWRPRGEGLDRLVAVALAIAAEVMLITGNVTPGLPRGLGAPLAIVMTGAIAFRRRWPLAVAVLLVACTNLIFLVGAHNYSVPLSIAWMCALYGLAVWTDTRGFLAGCAVFVASNFIAAAGPVVKLSDAVFFTVVPGIILVIVRRVVRERQLLAEALAARAELLEREHEMRASEAVAEERARIARELHDLVAHNVSVMVVQAGVERHALPPGQESTRATLTAIEQAGRQALVEARRLLGVLRTNGSGPPEGLEPQPSVDRSASSPSRSSAPACP
jgi:signal transduction histidine kinase